MGAPFVEVIPYVLDPATIQATASQVISEAEGGRRHDGRASAATPWRHATSPRRRRRRSTSRSGSSRRRRCPTSTAFARTYDQQQWAARLRRHALAARVNPADASGYRFLYQWFNGVEPPAADTIGVFQQPNPALFFAIVQAVGPNLTHETWRDALFAGEGTQAAISQPYLTLRRQGLLARARLPGHRRRHDHLVGPDGHRPGRDPQGGHRHVPVRRRRQALPARRSGRREEKLFDPEGAVTLYETPPPGEDPPDYPSPAG